MPRCYRVRGLTDRGRPPRHHDRHRSRRETAARSIAIVGEVRVRQIADGKSDRAAVAARRFSRRAKFASTASTCCRLPEQEMRLMRGNRISLVLQDPVHDDEPAPQMRDAYRGDAAQIGRSFPPRPVAAAEVSAPPGVKSA